MWRAAVLAAIKRQRPDDEAAWELAHQHFGCARETATSLQTRAQVYVATCKGSLWCTCQPW